MDLVRDMEIGEVRGYLKEKYFNGRKSALLLGEAGIGKSVATREAARDIAQARDKSFVDFAAADEALIQDIVCNPEKYFLFHDFRATELEPSDLLGIPQRIEIAGLEAMRYVPLLWAICLNKTAGMLFLDEFTQIQRLDVEAASYKTVLDRRAGDTYFSKDVMVVAAGNAPEHSKLANLLSAPLVNRFTIIKVGRPTLSQWARWMDENHPDWDRRILGYLQHFPDALLKMPDANETLEGFPTPRVWTDIACEIARFSEAFRLHEAIGKLGQETGLEFMGYLDTDVPDIEVLIENPSRFATLEKIDAKYLAATFVGVWLSLHTPAKPDDKADPKQKDIERIIPLINVMQKDREEFLVLAILSAGTMKSRAALSLIRSNKDLKRCLVDIVELDQTLDIGV